METYKKEIERATEEIGGLAAHYSSLSLSGCFSHQVEKSVKLFETHLESITDPECVKRIEESLNGLKRKLSLLEDAAEVARKKVCYPTITD